jgi:CHAT domain-containing protein
MAASERLTFISVTPFIKQEKIEYTSISTTDDGTRTYATAAYQGAMRDSDPASSPVDKATLRRLVPLLAVVVSAFLISHHQVDVLQSIAAAAPAERPFEGRLSDFPFRPLAAQMRGGSSEASEVVDIGPSHALIARAIGDAKRKRTVYNLHAAGVAYLIIGKPEAALKAVADALMKATGEEDLPKAIRASSDIALLNDLSVAAVAMIRTGQSQEPAAIALEVTQRLWTSQRTAETAWNRALALEKTGMKEEALRAWKDYQRLDRVSSWSSEAAAHVRRLETETRLVSSPPSSAEIGRLLDRDGSVTALSPNVCRLFLEESLLPALVDAAACNDSQETRRLLGIADRLMRATVEASADPSLPSVAADLARSVMLYPQSGRAQSLLRAVHWYVCATGEYRDNDIQKAKQDFARARMALQSIDSPLSAWVNFYLACCAYYDNAYDSCLSQLNEPSDEEMLRRGWRALVAKRNWVRALAFGVQNRRNEAIAELERAQALFGALGERDNVAAVASLLAEEWEYVGDREAAARARRTALALLPAVGDPLRRGKILNEAVEAAVNKDFLWTGLLLQDMTVSEADRSNRLLDSADAFMWRGLLWTRLGNASQARADFDRAEGLLPRIPDENVRDKTAADLSFFRAVADGGGRDPRALQSAAAFYRKAGNRVRLSQSYRLQAMSAIHRGALDEGEALLRQSLREIRVDEEQLTDAASKLIYTASASEVAAAAAQELLKHGKTDRAFSLLEDIRNVRSLTAPLPSFTPSAGTAVVVYLIGDELSYAWVIYGGLPRAVRLDCRRRDLRPHEDLLAERLPVDGVSDKYVDDALSALHDALIAPLAEFLTGAKTIVVVPDEAIANVPFPALRDRRTGHYLIEYAAITEAPSVSAFLSAERMAADPMRLPVDKAAMLMSSPTANGIAPLRELDREIAAVSRMARAVRLIGAAGTDDRASTLEAFANSTLLHFGGHGDFNAASPADSALIVGGDGGVPMRLTAREIVARCPTAKLIVLAACDSGRIGRSIPSAGMAQWLVAVGVTSVVATISRVDDGAAADLAIDYYRSLKQSPDSASALRAAQLAALRRGDRIGWPTFVHFGAPRRIDNGGSRDGFHND